MRGKPSATKMNNSGNEAKKSLKTKDLVFFRVQKRTENELVLYANRSKRTPNRTKHHERGEPASQALGADLKFKRMFETVV